MSARPDRPAESCVPAPPGPPPAETLAEELTRLRDLQKDVLGTFAQRFAVHGDLFYSRVRGGEMYATRDPDLIHDVLVDQAASYHKRTLDLEILGRGLLTNDGDDWRRQRRLIQPGFRSERIQRYAPLMRDEADRFVEGLVPGQVLELRSAMMELTLRVVCRALFGQAFAGNPRRLARAMKGLQEVVLHPKLLPAGIPSPYRFWRRRLESVVDREVFSIIDRDEADPESLLAELRAAGDAHGGMSRRQLRDEVVTLFLAGHETTALALTWTLYLLSVHPDAQAQVANELASRDAGGLDERSLEETGRALDESMRLYPPAYVIPRVARERVQLGGHWVEPGAEVWLWLYFLHRDARIFREPERFRPERFAPGGEISRHPRAYLPFGAGTRTCVGKHFARLEALIVLARLLSRFRLVAIDGRTLCPRPRITLAPARPVRVKLEPRR